jgi:hypothetical protein
MKLIFLKKCSEFYLKNSLHPSPETPVILVQWLRYNVCSEAQFPSAETSVISVQKERFSVQWGGHTWDGSKAGHDF